MSCGQLEVIRCTDTCSYAQNMARCHVTLANTGNPDYVPFSKRWWQAHAATKGGKTLTRNCPVMSVIICNSPQREELQLNWWSWLGRFSLILFVPQCDDLHCSSSTACMCLLAFHPWNLIVDVSTQTWTYSS